MSYQFRDDGYPEADEFSNNYDSVGDSKAWRSPAPDRQPWLEALRRWGLDLLEGHCTDRRWRRPNP